LLYSQENSRRLAIVLIHWRFLDVGAHTAGVEVEQRDTSPDKDDQEIRGLSPVSGNLEEFVRGKIGHDRDFG
jgi:hypothetical protein